MNARRFVMLFVATLIGLSGCGGDDDETALDTGVGADSGESEEAACAPVGEDLEDDATETVAIQLDEYSFSPATLELEAEIVTFAAENVGSENHELAFLPGGGEVPLTDTGEPDEAALADAGAFELEAFGSGRTCNATYDLDPGTYTLFCFVTSPDGQTHYENGMEGELVVR